MQSHRGKCNFRIKAKLLLFSGLVGLYVCEEGMCGAGRAARVTESVPSPKKTKFAPPPVFPRNLVCFCFCKPLSAFSSRVWRGADVAAGENPRFLSHGGSKAKMPPLLLSQLGKLIQWISRKFSADFLCSTWNPSISSWQSKVKDSPPPPHTHTLESPLCQGTLGGRPHSV